MRIFGVRMIMAKPAKMRTIQSSPFRFVLSRKNGLNSLDSADIIDATGVLVKMTMVGDHERRRNTFTLDRASDVRVICIGEGLDGRMYDYGYIVDEDTGDTVWEMRYRRTKHAGGARKNRIHDRVIRLDAGTYKAVYMTDGSHSFEDWNDDRPRDH